MNFSYSQYSSSRHTSLPSGITQTSPTSTNIVSKGGAPCSYSKKAPATVALPSDYTSSDSYKHMSGVDRYSSSYENVMPDEPSYALMEEPDWEDFSHTEQQSDTPYAPYAESYGKPSSYFTGFSQMNTQSKCIGVLISGRHVTTPPSASIAATVDGFTEASMWSECDSDSEWKETDSQRWQKQDGVDEKLPEQSEDSISYSPLETQQSAADPVLSQTTSGSNDGRVVPATALTSPGGYTQRPSLTDNKQSSDDDRIKTTSYGKGSHFAKEPELSLCNKQLQLERPPLHQRDYRHGDPSTPMSRSTVTHQSDIESFSPIAAEDFQFNSDEPILYPLHAKDTWERKTGKRSDAELAKSCIRSRDPVSTTKLSWRNNPASLANNPTTNKTVSVNSCSVSRNPDQQQCSPDNKEKAPPQNQYSHNDKRNIRPHGERLYRPDDNTENILTNSMRNVQECDSQTKQYDCRRKFPFGRSRVITKKTVSFNIDRSTHNALVSQMSVTSFNSNLSVFM